MNCYFWLIFIFCTCVWRRHLAPQLKGKMCNWNEPTMSRKKHLTLIKRTPRGWLVYFWFAFGTFSASHLFPTQNSLGNRRKKKQKSQNNSKTENEKLFNFYLPWAIRLRWSYWTLSPPSTPKTPTRTLAKRSRIENCNLWSRWNEWRPFVRNLQLQGQLLLF